MEFVRNQILILRGPLNETIDPNFITVSVPIYEVTYLNPYLDITAGLRITRNGVSLTLYIHSNSTVSVRQTTGDYTLYMFEVREGPLFDNAFVGDEPPLKYSANTDSLTLKSNSKHYTIKLNPVRVGETTKSRISQIANSRIVRTLLSAGLIVGLATLLYRFYLVFETGRINALWRGK